MGVHPSSTLLKRYVLFFLTRPHILHCVDVASALYFSEFNRHCVLWLVDDSQAFVVVPEAEVVIGLNTKAVEGILQDKNLAIEGMLSVNGSGLGDNSRPLSN